MSEYLEVGLKSGTKLIVIGDESASFLMTRIKKQHNVNVTTETQELIFDTYIVSDTVEYVTGLVEEPNNE